MPKIFEYKGKVFCEISAEALSALGMKPGDELEFRKVYDRLVVVVPGAGIGEDETSILKKLNTIRYSERTAEKCGALLNPKEQELLKNMIGKGIVYEYSKEGKRLLGISKDYYKYAIGAPEEKPAKEATIPPLAKETPMPSAPKETSKEDETLARLEKEGFLVLENEGMAQLLTQKLKAQGKDTAVEGVRGFDKKFYIIKKDRLADFEAKITKALKGGGKKLDDLAAALSLDAGLCRAGMEVLREQGKVIEKRKGIYGLA